MRARGQDAVPSSWDVFARHAGEPFAFFVDRAGTTRPSFAGSRPASQFVVDADGSARTWTGSAWKREDGDPLDRLEAFVERSRGGAQAPALPDWLDGEVLPRTVGFLSYELGAWADGRGPEARRRTGTARPGPGTPLAVLTTYDEFDARDGATGRTARVRFADPPRRAAVPPAPPIGAGWHETRRGEWLAGFARILEAIRAGEVYQANLSRRAVFDFDGDAAAAYALLRDVQPVPFGAFLDFGGFALLSNSPELFLARRGDEVTTRPIKGTRARSADPTRDAEAAAALSRDPKDGAEHLMIVDLERNDLGRVARTGTVRVPRLAGVESWATVHHLVSDVVATLRPATGLADLLRATFPGGSITGAPKIRAMELLAEVEVEERGPYTGAIGLFDGGKDFELSIAIRTAVAAGTRLLYSTGGGIVADSDPAREWEETEWKVAALGEALARRRSELAAQAGNARRARSTGT